MSQTKAPWYYLLLIILAGESVFILPFVLARVFRPTVLEVFELSNLELGLCYSVYGIVAMLSYPFGGPLADKFQPRKLIAIALWMTALGGFVYATFPSYNVLKILYGYWGFTTIFLFWAPMIKATRVWGGTNSQGKAFGFLDGGRGLVGALFGTLGVIIFSLFLTSEIAKATLIESRVAFKQVIIVSSSIVILVGILVWFFLRLDKDTEKKIVLDQIKWKQVKEVLRLPSVWLLMIIIMCGYVGYKITDVFSQYATDVMMYNPVESAQVGTFLLYIRPVVGVLIGIVADRSKITLLLLLSFIIAFFGSLMFAFGYVQESVSTLFFVSIFIVAAGVYGIRSLYFAVMQRGKIPLVLTGTAVGIISLIGFTPDIFAGPTYGYLLDNSPGIKGHQHVFWMLALFSFVGGIAAFLYFKMYGKKKNE
ncbi:MFS transporter [Pontimicrobium aquaticum]|uniref:MFS transporter n=1 Tax=Pontimicrobium aquaticum TaxID=2565367 RepID=A0A4U0F3A2_9FLAO|nr:MFS transporter [Pontimicrobium aquaticum]TJY37212.1 MFS transporter [Pontimicrobium aquaticum]